MRSFGIAGRVFLFTAAIVCAVLVAALAVASHSGRRAAREAERRGLEQGADLTAQLLAGRWRSLAGGARVFVQGPYFRALVAQRQSDDILDQTFEAQEQLGADWVFITDERGLLLAKSDEPGAQGVSMAGIPLVAGALEGRTTSGYGVSRDTLLFQTVAVPIVVPGAAPVGVLVATKVMDRQMALDVRAATNSEVVFYTLDARGAPHVAATSLADAPQAAAALPVAGALPPSSRPSDPAAARRTRIGGAPFALQGAALTTAGGEIVGGFVVGRAESAMPREIAGVRRSLLIAGLLGLALALAAAWSAARHVTRPSRALAAAATRALDGDYATAARSAVEATTGTPRDEIAALGAALAALLEELREKQSLVSMLGHALGATGTEGRQDVAPAHGVDDPSLSSPVLDLGPRPRGTSPAISWLLRSRSTARPVGALTTGTVVAERYALQEVLGSGGTGIVYKAADLTLGETVALKVLRPELVADDPRAREELKHELRLTRRVSHRNVVRTYDFGSSHGVPFITMEYVHGASLAAVLAQRGALPADVVLALAKQLTRALEAAHEQGVMHGDLKPANLLVAMDGLLKVTDFGVATLVRRPWAKPGPDEVVSPPQLAGAVVGTPEYMAPELLLGSRPDVRTDLYAAGMVLHECLTGQTPFQGDTPRGFLARKLDSSGEAAGRRTPAAEARGPSAPGAGGSGQATTVERVIAWMVAADAEARPTSAAEVGEALARVG
jgi:HAMP domain-containing protein/predicted Ser/Thr protein kinase/predicted secreted protein